MFGLLRRTDEILLLWRRPARSLSTKLFLLYRGLAPGSNSWVEGLNNLHPTLILAQGILTLTKNGFTPKLQIIALARLGVSLSLSVCAQVQAGEE